VQVAIGVNDTSSAANPLIDIWLQMATAVDDDNTGTVLSMLTDPEALSFVLQVEEESGAMVTVQTHTCDVVNDQIADPLTGSLQPGHYAAAFSPATTTTPIAPGSRCSITWSWTMPNGSQGKMTREFDVLPNVPPGFGWGYCTPSDLRREGFSPRRCDDRRLLRLIRQQSQYIDRVTGRFFEPRYQVQTVNGSGGRAVLLGDPIIALQLVTLGNPVVNTIGPESLRIFNRHITAGVTSPDDRDNPKIEFVHYRDIFGRQRSASIDSPLFGVPFRDLFFPGGVQNVNVTALFGYTDPDRSATGCTPDMIRHATMLLVAREAAKLSSDDRDDRKRHRLTSEGTRDQRYTLQESTEGAFTGDREIDDILLMFMRPPRISSP
jgi:hypothetical protein